MAKATDTESHLQTATSGVATARSDRPGPGVRRRLSQRTPDAPGSAGAGERRRSVVLRVAQVSLVVVAIGVWEWVGHGSKTQNLTISTPWTVAQWIGRWMAGEQAHGFTDLFATLEEAALGWLLGIAVGVLLAAALAASNWLRLVAAPFVSVLNALPKIALAPLFILVWGEALQSKIYFVTAGIFFITFYNVFGGLRSIDPLYVRNGRVLGASRMWLVREVYAPAIVGWVMTSLRLTAAWALTSAVIAEYLGSNKGMGYVVSLGQGNADVPEVLGGVIVVAVVALLIDRIIVRVERHFSRWRLE